MPTRILIVAAWTLAEPGNKKALEAAKFDPDWWMLDLRNSQCLNTGLMLGGMLGRAEPINSMFGKAEMLAHVSKHRETCGVIILPFERWKTFMADVMDKAPTDSRPGSAIEVKFTEGQNNEYVLWTNLAGERALS